MSGYCTDELVTELSTYCPHLRHLSANNSKALSDVALSALTGMLTRGAKDLFVRGCKQLKRLGGHHTHRDLSCSNRKCSRLEIFNCPLVTASKLVSLMLILPKVTYISSEKLPLAFESSALFETGQKYQLTNFEHRVSHLEKAREKINHHLKSLQDSQFLLRVAEIFPKILSVKLSLSSPPPLGTLGTVETPGGLESQVLSQIIGFRNIRTLILELPQGRMEENFFQDFLLERGPQLSKLCIRVNQTLVRLDTGN